MTKADLFNKRKGPGISPGYAKLMYRDIAAARAIVMAGNDFEVRRLSGSIGAEILRIDLASEPGDNAIGEIRQVWLEHNVIFFRDQDLPPAKFLAFATPHARLRPDPSEPKCSLSATCRCALFHSLIQHQDWRGNVSLALLK
jgi:hypothetical protein